MTYHIGQVVPFDYQRGILGAKLDTPRHHAIITPPNKERATVEMLKAKGMFAFYPKREVSHFVRKRKITRDYPQISRIIYAKFTRAPNWDVMLRRKWITGVFSIGDRPIAIPSEVIRQLQGLPGRAEALRQAREELQQVVVGDVAQLPDGPLAGHFVQVTSVESGGRVWWQSLTSSLIKGQTSAGKIERKDAPNEADIQSRADELMGHY